MVIHEYGNPSAKTVLIQPVDEHDLAGMENEIESIRKLAGDEFRLLAVKIRDWNRELSPRQAPAVFGKEGFGAGAAETLAEILKLCEDGSKTYMMRMNFMRLLEIVQNIIFQLLGTDSCLSVGNMLKMKEYDHVRISFNNGRRKATYLRLEI